MTNLLRSQYDEMVSDNAQLQALVSERDAEIARLREALESVEVQMMIPYGDGHSACCLCSVVSTGDKNEHEAACLLAALAARGGAS